MIKFYAVIEFLPGQRAGILTLTDQSGEWAGSGRIEGRNRSDIYERAYQLASLSAQSKGGRLERFTQAEPSPPRNVLPETCGARVTPPLQLRRANALNIEAAQPLARCLDKKPAHWPEGASALRWIASGGEATVFGLCSSNCPREQ